MIRVNILLWQPSLATGHLYTRSHFLVRFCNTIAFHVLALYSDLASRECNSSIYSKPLAVQFDYRCQNRHCCDRRPFQVWTFRVLCPWIKLRAIRQAIIRACTQLFANYEPCMNHSRLTEMRDLSSAALINICLSFTYFPTFDTLRSCK